MTARGSVRARKAADEALAQPIQQKVIMLSPTYWPAADTYHFPQTLRDLRNELGQTFGTKKAKKAILSLTENAILRKEWRRKPT